ncbi:helix-turn-helix transcriptional regulator [Neobacillus vireti]|uniref:helix-turn-helix domain-containing protein n=1 Tax=Neobacillus vireti TaxID=220686 RepID=UPI0030003216
MGKKVKINIPKLLVKLNMSLREFSRRTDIRHSTLSELSNGKRERISFRHIESIADTFNITDIREIITLEDTED